MTETTRDTVQELRDQLLELKTREARSLPRRVETRAADGASEATEITGYAALFNTPTTIAETFVEVIERGAFDATIGDDVRVLFNHDPNQILGRTKSGTARLSIDHDGLRYSVSPPETQTGRDVLALVQRGDVDGSSFGFRVLADRWEPGATSDDLPTRFIERVRLLDVAPVVNPAYSETTAEARDQAAATVGDVAPPQTVDTLAARRLAYAKQQLGEHAND